MDVAAGATSAAHPRRKLPLARLLFVFAGAALLIFGAGYALRFVSASDFHRERAFRVLDEIAGQLDNLQRTLVNQLRLMPKDLTGVACVKALATEQNRTSGLPTQAAQNCSSSQSEYVRRLALKGPRVTLSSVDAAVHASACSAGSSSTPRYGFVIDASQPGAPFTAFSCLAHAEPVPAHAEPAPAKGGSQLSLIGFTGPMTGVIESFVTQGFFDEVLVALEDGTVIAAAPRSSVRSGNVQVHAARARRLGVAHIGSMLRNAGEAGAPAPDADTGATDLSVQPRTFRMKLAGDRYRVFVELLRPAYGIHVESNGVERNGIEAAQRQDRLYLVGLKRDDLRADIAGSIEPGGRFTLTILVMLALLSWPLANLRAKSPEDPISWPEAVACLISIVLIPAVIAIVAVWVWSYQGVLTWADKGASVYAGELTDVLEGQLRDGRELLYQYHEIYSAELDEMKEKLEMNPARAIRVRHQNSIDAAGALSFVTASSARCLDPERLTDQAGGDPGAGQVSVSSGDKTNLTCVLGAARKDSVNRFGAWSPYSTLFATGVSGSRHGLRFTVYDAPIIDPQANYAAREYFRSLQLGEGWFAGDGPPDSYVAQRIYSGGDGSRVLQVAVPRTCGVQGKSEFCGIISGSLSVHALSAAVSPPLLRFAVIDRRSGLVIFHSDETRSLAENFFIETERNPELQSLAAIGQSGAFQGYYVGSAHRFQHAPVQGAPWSVVVFYPVQAVGDLSWHAVLTALGAYSGAMLVILLASGFILWLWFKRSRQGVRNFAARFWYRAGCSCSYAHWGVGLFGGATAIVTLYEKIAGGALSPITWAMWGLAALAALVVFMQHERASHSTCIAIWLLLISAVPAAWMALAYHDVQMQGMLRDALLSANQDIERRQSAIASDLRRWLSGRQIDPDVFPDPWELTQPSQTMPVPGFTSGTCEDPDTPVGGDSWTTCVFGPMPLRRLVTKRELDFWRRETWDAAARDETQQRRIRLLGSTSEANPKCSPGVESYSDVEGRLNLDGETCIFVQDGGASISISVALHESTDDVSDDRMRFNAATSAAWKTTSLGAAFGVPWLLAAFASRRLLGVNDGADAQAKFNHRTRSTLFHSRDLDAATAERILVDSQGVDGAASSPSTRINLATNALYSELISGKPLTGTLVLTNLDIALTDATRRPKILGVLERLIDDPEVKILIFSRTSPIERLYHPERYPESGPDHVMSLDEALRWDNVLQKLDCREVDELDTPRRHEHLRGVDHHRIWKLCTRAERLLLYQIATGRLANPRNQTVIQNLVRRGLVQVNPWPMITDNSFERFVRTAETSQDLAQWQREASRTSGSRARTAIIAAVLIAVLIVVVWFSWTAGDQLKIISTILAASVAFLSQIGNAMNFVRGGGKGG